MRGALDDHKHYAVLFRTHLWNDYIARQHRRLLPNAGGGDVFVLLDETGGPVAVEGARVVSHTVEQVTALGLSDGGAHRMLWYNGDYPLYYFFNTHRDYRYYVMIEYDVAINGNIDGMVDHADRHGIGLMALTKGEAVVEWPHTESCLDVYDLGDVKKRLICFSIFSREAVEALFERRLALSRLYSEGRLQRWPFCEGFIPTELAHRGFKLAEISIFGSTELYDWQPPIVETDLTRLRHHAFVHPVLDQRRYLDATMRSDWRLWDILNPTTDFSRRLRRVPARMYARPLAGAVRRRLANAVRARFGAWRAERGQPGSRAITGE
jgi:hypothetical protein